MNGDKAEYVLKLYISGCTENSARAVDNLKLLLDENVKDKYALEIIDVLKNPQLAEHDKVFATPTVVKVLPPPVKKVMGNLSKEKKVLSGLGLQAKTPEIET